MSKTVKVNGVTYNGVNSVKLQAADGGEAIFYDSAPTVPQESDINFWDYDGTLLYVWTLAELAGKTELPPLPSHDGLICQGWNWTLQDIKSVGHAVDVGAMYITDDGKTRIYIHLEEGRTSPMLGCCPNGTVTVDWGDGTTPDTLTGTSVTAVKWTPNHAYAAPGDYVITLTVDGAFGFYGASATNENSGLLRFASGADTRNAVYQRAITKIELGSRVTALGANGLRALVALKAITLPLAVASIAESVFYMCRCLTFVAIPSALHSVGAYVFGTCGALAHMALPKDLTAVPAGFVRTGASFMRFQIPDGVTSIGTAAFQDCYALAEVAIPDGVTVIQSNAFNGCTGLSSLTIPSSVTSIAASAFYNCTGIKFYDFTRHTAVPTLANANAFSGIAADCEIRVPASLVDTWKAATNWSTYADQIVGIQQGGGSAN